MAITDDPAASPAAVETFDSASPATGEKVGTFPVDGPEQVAAAVAWGGMANAGQTCIGIERVYAVAPVYDRFVEKVVERAGRLRAGPGAGAAGGHDQRAGPTHPPAPRPPEGGRRAAAPVKQEAPGA